MILDLDGGLVGGDCFETEVRRRDLVLRYRLRRGGRQLTLDSHGHHFNIIGARNGGYLKVDDAPIHGTILVEGTQVTTHFSDERFPKGDPRRWTTGPGLDFAPLRDEEFAAAFSWTFEQQIRRLVRELRTIDELYALGGEFLTYVPTTLQLTEGMGVGEVRESLAWWAPVVGSMAWRVPPVCFWAAWKAPLQPLGILATVDEGRVWFVPWDGMMTVTRRLLDQFRIPGRPAFDLDRLLA